MFAMIRRRLPIVVIVGVALAALLALATFSSADAAEQDGATKEKTDAAKTEGTAQEGPITIENHAWSTYHWARTSNPVKLKIGDNVSSVWDSSSAPHLDTTIADWNKSNELENARTTGGTNPKNCRATNGRVEVCNSKYGNNGWLGIASIWVNGSHIYQGTTKLNDTYFNTSTYNKPAWRNLVMCQEVGHDFGLGHQDENFENPNLNTCMDYTSNPVSNEHPNQHDYDQLAEMYSHNDPSTTIGQTSASDENEPGNGPPAWGREIFRSSDGRESIYEKDLGKGKKKLTHVLWTLEKAAQHRGGGPDKDHEHQEDQQAQQKQQEK